MRLAASGRWLVRNTSYDRDSARSSLQISLSLNVRKMWKPKLVAIGQIYLNTGTVPSIGGNLNFRPEIKF